MDFDDLLDNCRQLEQAIQMLIRSNAFKQAKYNRLQTEMVEANNDQQKQLAEMDQKFQIELSNVKTRSEQLELEIKQVSIINDELSEVVNRAQQASHVKPDETKVANQTYHYMGGVIEGLDEIRANYKQISDGIQSLERSSVQDKLEAKAALGENKGLVVELHKNASLVRLLEKQGKFTEQQFDLILNQIPWQPLTQGYIKELRQSNNADIRDLADTLALQVSEIQDLEESLLAKKEKKLEILKNLTDQLNLFVSKRSEAILIENRSINRHSLQ